MFFNDFLSPKNTKNWPFPLEPDLAGKRKALIWIIGSSVEKPKHAEISMRTSRENSQAEVHFRVTFINSICRCLESLCFCYYLLSLDGTCCCCLWRFNVCYYLRPGPLPFAPCFCCLLLFRIICYYWPLCTAVCCYLPLLAAFCIISWFL